MLKEDSQLFGTLIGAFAGYVFRPSVYGLKQLNPFEIIAYSLQGNGQAQAVAYASITYILLGAAIGWFIGSVVGRTPEAVNNLYEDNDLPHNLNQSENKEIRIGKQFGWGAALLSFIFIAHMGIGIGVYVAGPDKAEYGLIGGALVGIIAGLLFALKIKSSD
ncbi:hypothetical protein MettiDRAFT_0806 [Methanolobus tindarius DSM 2278]|jgi:hypothetical protein|uniref:Uncharacterized protein n=1 Tax=Methanolobus tindarius DSM 2278 TaxID=1090322 RepID=W9DUM0_METTI|nr:hypothetical protein [Methanolobus tindarius]ETA67382.1 hypothetical protein MettiDRAFT_0806 [Methanolobus tindarius DSM 2278]